jgi:hypothetical protein
MSSSRLFWLVKSGGHKGPQITVKQQSSQLGLRIGPVTLIKSNITAENPKIQPEINVPTERDSEMSLT